MKPVCLVCLFVLLVSAAMVAQTNPVPLLNNPLVPASAAPGGGQFTLTVNGTGFVSDAVVNWNGTALATNFVSSSRLTATVPAANIATASTAAVTVVNPAPGGSKSNVNFFEIRQPFTAVSFGKSAVGAGMESETVTTSDLNNDGKLDLVTVDETDAIVSVFLGNGDGTFQLQGQYVILGSFPYFITVADLNGDGNQDLVVAYSAGVAILLGNGDGSFQSPTEISIPGITYSSGAVISADFNADGKVDLAITNFGVANIFVLLGNGDGTFQPAMSYAAGNYVEFGLVTGDFNQDGKLDLAVAVRTDNAIAILLGNGDGTFQSPIEYATPESPYGVSIADINGDGILDLVAECYGNGAGQHSVFSVLLGNANGTFQGHVDRSTLNAGFSATLADLNGDGKLDVVVSYFDIYGVKASVISAFLGNGDGTFQSENLFPVDFATFPAFGDFNGDGRMDIATTAASLNVSLSAASVLSRTFANFGKVKTGGSSSVKVALSNIGNSSFTISRIVLSGRDTSEFGISNDCGHSLAAGATCSISITFKPTTIGRFVATVKVSDSAVTPAQTIYLQGEGVN